MYFHQGYGPPPNPYGHFSTLILSDPRKLRLSLTLRSRLSTIVNTAIIAKIPMVTPNKERTVLRRLDLRAFQANLKLSSVKRMISKAFYLLVDIQYK